MSSTKRSTVRHKDDFYKTEPWVTRLILPFLTQIKDEYSVLDLGSGDGAIGGVLREYSIARVDECMRAETLWIEGIELDEFKAIASGDIKIEVDGRARCVYDRVYNADFRNFDTGILGDGNAHVDLTIGNPPYSLALEAIQFGIEISLEQAFLLRLNFLGSQERVAFHRQHPADVYILPKRPSYAKSVKCKERCGWEILLLLEEAHPKRCPKCGAKVIVIKSDSTEYAWFVYGPGRGNRYYHLDVELINKSPVPIIREARPDDVWGEIRRAAAWGEVSELANEHEGDEEPEAAE